MGESSTYQDKTLTCADCRQEFVWSAKEQEFFAEKKFDPPKRCLDCRRKRREEKKQQKGAKGNSRSKPRGGNCR